MKVVQAYDATNNELPIPPPQAPIAPPTILPLSLVLSLSPMLDSRDFLPPEEISPKDTKTSVLPTLVSPSSSIGSSSPVRSTIPPPDYPFDKSIFAELDNSLWIIPMPPKRTSTSEAPAMTQDDIKKLVADSVSAALEAQAANMANTDNTTRPRETHIARNCTYKEFMSCQPFYFNGTEGDVVLVNWFERTESVFSRSNCTEDCKVKFSTGTLTEDALSWWNSYAKPIGIEQADKIAWTKLKRLLTNKYCPRTDVKKTEDEFYNLVVKGNDLKTYIRRFQELETLCPTMVPNSEKLMKNRKQETFKTYVSTNRVGHLTRNYKIKRPTTGKNLQPVSVTCNAYGEKGHYANQCSKASNRTTGKLTY
nr:reverse transcriptase domain-containing protein [Tanacetum cinerariifolium]